MMTKGFSTFISAETWTWEELFTALSKERSLGECLEVPAAAMSCPVEAVGRPYIREGVDLLSGDKGFEGDIRTFRVDVSDGSYLLVDVVPGHYQLNLVPAPLPMVGWLPSLAPLPWLTLPSALLLLALSVLI